FLFFLFPFGSSSSRSNKISFNLSSKHFFTFSDSETLSKYFSYRKKRRNNALIDCSLKCIEEKFSCFKQNLMFDSKVSREYTEVKRYGFLQDLNNFANAFVKSIGKCSPVSSINPSRRVYFSGDFSSSFLFFDTASFLFFSFSFLFNFEDFRKADGFSEEFD